MSIFKVNSDSTNIIASSNLFHFKPRKCCLRITLYLNILCNNEKVKGNFLRVTVLFDISLDESVVL